MYRELIRAVLVSRNAELGKRTRWGTLAETLQRRRAEWYRLEKLTDQLGDRKSKRAFPVSGLRSCLSCTAARVRTWQWKSSIVCRRRSRFTCTV